MPRTFRLLLLLALVTLWLLPRQPSSTGCVPEDQIPDVEDAVPAITFLSLPETQGELATLATHAHTGGQKTAIGQLTDVDTMAKLTQSRNPLTEFFSLHISPNGVRLERER